MMHQAGARADVVPLQVLLFPAMKPEENKPAGGAIKPQVSGWTC